MNWILLYSLCLLAIIIVLTTGYFLNKRAIASFKIYENRQSQKKIISKELALKLFSVSGLRSTSLTVLKAKKSNYFSAKYNAIKLTPETTYSNCLFDLAICSKCALQAKKQQYNYISSAIKYIVSLVSNLISILFIPTILICSILNISFGLEKFAFLATITIVICYFASFLLSLLILCLNKLSTKNIIPDLEKTGFFEPNEINELLSIIKEIYNFEFFNYTRLSLILFSLANPATYLNK